MNRPSIAQLPCRRLSLSDLKNERLSKGKAFFHTRLVSEPKQICIPSTKSKKLNDRLLDLYPSKKAVN